MAQNEHRPTVSARATTAQRHQGLREALLAVARVAIESHGREQLRTRELAPTALPVLQEQIALLVRAMIRGLSLTAGEY